METMRLFVAVNLPSEEKRRIAESCNTLTELPFPIRWVREETLHLTLKFLGDTPGHHRRDLDAALSRAAGRTEPFEMVIRGVGAFPDLRRPRVVWMGVDQAPALRCLREDVESGLAELGFEREERGFHPHLTLGRAKRHARPGDFRDLAGVARGVSYSATVRVASVDLMESRLSPSGARYTVLTRHELGEKGRG